MAASTNLSQVQQLLQQQGLNYGVTTDGQGNVVFTTGPYAGQYAQTAMTGDPGKSGMDLYAANGKTAYNGAGSILAGPDAGTNLNTAPQTVTPLQAALSFLAVGMPLPGFGSSAAPVAAAGGDTAATTAGDAGLGLGGGTGAITAPGAGTVATAGGGGAAATTAGSTAATTAGGGGFWNDLTKAAPLIGAGGAILNGIEQGKNQAAQIGNQQQQLAQQGTQLNPYAQLGDTQRQALANYLLNNYTPMTYTPPTQSGGANPTMTSAGSFSGGVNAALAGMSNPNSGLQQYFGPQAMANANAGFQATLANNPKYVTPTLPGPPASPGAAGTSTGSTNSMISPIQSLINGNPSSNPTSLGTGNGGVSANIFNPTVVNPAAPGSPAGQPAGYSPAVSRLSQNLVGQPQQQTSPSVLPLNLGA